MKLSLITCTGARPEAFALCEKWMSRQTHGWAEWIVVCDGEEPTDIRYSRIVIRPTEKWQPGQNTLRKNLDLALQCVTGDAVAFIEDDDYYKPQYLAMMMQDLKEHNAVGEMNATYYNVKFKKWRFLCNLNHACLCQTVIRKELIPLLRCCIAEDTGESFDITFWRELMSLPPAEAKPLLHANSAMVVGMKGMPGRKGIGVGHSPEGPWMADPEFAKLRSLLGADTKEYSRFLYV